MQLYKDGPSSQIGSQAPKWDHDEYYTFDDKGNRIAFKGDADLWAKDWKAAWKIGDYYPAEDPTYSDYVGNTATNLDRISDRAEIDDQTRDLLAGTKKYNANVIINEGAEVVGYAYGGGLGDAAVERSGDVYGTTYIALLGGTVMKDLYAAGTAGAVTDLFEIPGATTFTASANAYVKGGTCRNVYGGGWKGNVGRHDGAISASTDGDIAGNTYVVIGDLAGTGYASGIPAIQRNAYGGGEGGAVYGTAHLTLNNGYIGYTYNASGSDDGGTKDFDEHYEENIADITQPMPNTNLKDAGCLFGGGYIDNSIVDKTNVRIYGGHVRSSAFGGGEIAAIGRGTMSKTTSGGKTTLSLAGIHRPGKTLLEMFDGHVKRNVYGGGRGYDNLNRHGSLNSDGYIFGQTEVHIYGGEIGTAAGIENGDGNVFGACDIGMVYSAYENTDGTFGKGVKSGERYDGGKEGYYYQHAFADGGAFVEGYQLTEDCKVLVAPECRVTTPVRINNHDYNIGDFVPIADLNTLKDKNTSKDQWSRLSDEGIVIHNAVFAGGNTVIGSSTTNANLASVFGNATASVNDVYHRDLITLGTGHTGGLYGEGNLTLVDGYRELNITNYGTDYYSIAKEITIEQYHALPEREAAYYELKYTCQKDCKDKEGTSYKAETLDAQGFVAKASTITADELQTLFVTTDDAGNKVSVKDGDVAILVQDPVSKEWMPNPEAGYWKESGVLPVYAGRPMNSIQRADFCGVFGSRMVMQGAQDRVPEVADYTNYTINRVREVSLNKKESVITGDESTMHGNYFGIYNVVNYLGALTSDVDFHTAKRTTSNPDTKYKADSDGQTYYDWKSTYIKDRKRNNGSSHNKLALASGVYLEITTEKSTGKDLYEKDWGPITGVVELDLINVAPGIGGGFVYAKNVHGVRSETGVTNSILTTLNTGAATKAHFTYTEPVTSDATQSEWESSGNFVHSTQTIIDDCYNISNRYTGTEAMPAHYWYIKGSVYVYDQYISAYTGGASAYSETVDIPLTIAAASHGKMKLLNVMPNRYAFYSAPGVELGEGKKVVINDKTYYKNDPISYWDYFLLSNAEKELFVEKTYTNCITCKIDGVEYAAGAYVMTDAQFDVFKGQSHTYTDADGKTIVDSEKNAVGTEYIFRESNNVSHDEGYMLTYQVNNPSIWNTWYTPKSGDYTDKKTTEEYDVLNASAKADYYDGPTYRLNPTALDGASGLVLGQSNYQVGDIIPKSIEDTYQAITSKPAKGQATFVPAYIVTSKFTVTEGGKEHNYYPGATISKTLADDHTSETTVAYIATKSIQLTKDDVIYKGTTMSETEAQGYTADTKSKMNVIASGAGEWTVETIYTSALSSEQKNKLTQLALLRDELTAHLVPAYYCTGDGFYGGNYYESDKNYRGLEAFSAMSEADRKKFIFNYDALDLLIDPTYSNKEGEKYQYDGDYDSEAAVRAGNKAGYSVTQSVDYTATYTGTSNLDLGEKEVIVKRGDISTTTKEIQPTDELSRETFEGLTNEQRHYAAIAVLTAGDYYVVNTPFQIGSTPYAVGEVISESTYLGLSDKTTVTKLTFDENEDNATYYYCRENYTKGGDVTPISSATVPGAAGGISDGKVLLGTLINSTEYGQLPNQQKNFTIHGISPTEISTLFVSRESDIYDLSKEKIITVVYQYDYEETDGENVTPVSERHVVNIHLQFKSGVPVVENIDEPDLILPGWLETLREPNVTPGAYEVTGGGWEIFETEGDALRHINGIDYAPAFDPLYWYQNGYYVSYYAKTYLGRTYSNAVPLKVGNYHDLADVMSDANKEHHMYIDHQDCDYEPKIYINDYSASGKNGLDLFKNLYDLSVLSSPNVDDETGLITSETFNGHKPLNDRVKAGKGLEFFLRTDIEYTEPWTPIGTYEQCFEGNLHGDGHTISGLDNSLFYNLCGNVYNLGVTGSFNSAGVVDMGTGYVESAWVKTTGTPDGTVRAVFGAPKADRGYKQIVNSYYQTGKSYSTTDDDSHGLATAMPERAFYNGEVAYDLNNFYLYKRYSDKQVTSGDETQKYSYFTIGNDDNLSLQNNHYYSANPELCSTGYEDKSGNVIMYVEDRFADGDFRYAGGTIPESEDERFYTWTDNGTVETAFFPIWPDDYIFFGQKLTYGWAAQAHQEVPTAVVRDGGRLSQTENANRVYRAPAYYRSKTMGVAHFNPHAYLAQTKKDDATTKAYPNMTAIDFKGHEEDHAASAYKKGFNDDWFYQPLLDDDGLLSIQNCDETQNLLAYAPAADDNAKTYSVLNSYFVDPVFDDHYDNSKGYRQVEESTASIRGHLVQSDLTATNDHLLVDKQDFNAPIAYNFDADHLMWYQRKPADKEYVDFTKGWQGISLPFTAELVTTHQKGEITHFYSGSETSKNGTGSKIGHEYWLREFKEGGSTVSDVYNANFTYPNAAGSTKTVSNTFLWDYYYKNESVHNQLDENADTYLQYRQYYEDDEREYGYYPLLTAAKPYILGLPGQTYYEFDLSGKFEAQNTAVSISKLDKQVITFASNKGVGIGVSDDEMAGVTYSNYTFKPSYMNQTLEAGTDAYALDADGSKFVKMPDPGDAKTVSAFRPYFTASAGSRQFMAKQIVFGDADGQFGVGPETALDGSLEIYVRGRIIVTRSHMKEPVAVRIINAAGATLKNFVLQPGETIETPTVYSGVYIVNNKKVFVAE